AVLYARYAGRAVPWRQALLFPGTDAFFWSGLALVAFALARCFPLERGRLLRGLAVHLPAGLALSIVESVLAFAVLFAIGTFRESPMPPQRMMGGLAIGRLQQNLLTYATLVGLAQSADTYRKFREREVRASQLE